VRKLDFPIEPSRPHEGWVQNVCSVGSSNDLHAGRHHDHHVVKHTHAKSRALTLSLAHFDVFIAAKPVKLIQQLEHRPLHFPIAAGL